EARATLLATEAARDEAEAIARIVGAEMRADAVSIQDIAKSLHQGTNPDVHLVLLDTEGRVLFGESEREPGTVMVETPIVAEGRPFLETFAADLSHELKNPVAAVRASAEVLDEGALAEPEEARRFVARIREATARIETLLGEILSLARIEARGVDSSSEVDVGALARAASDAA